MKYLLMTVLAGLFVISPAFAERDDDEKEERREKRERSQWKILQSISAAERKRLRPLHAANPETWREEVAKIVKRIRAEKQE